VADVGGMILGVAMGTGMVPPSRCFGAVLRSPGELVPDGSGDSHPRRVMLCMNSSKGRVAKSALVGAASLIVTPLPLPRVQGCGRSTIHLLLARAS